MPVKTKKYPKRPKQSASLAVWENFNKRCAEIDKENAAKISAEKKRQTLIKKATTRKPKTLK